MEPLTLVIQMNGKIQYSMRLILQKRIKYLRTFTLFRVRNSSPYILLNTISTITEKKFAMYPTQKEKKMKFDLSLMQSGVYISQIHAKLILLWKLGAGPVWDMKYAN